MKNKKISLDQIIINCFDTLIQQKIENNKIPIVSIFDIQMKIHSIYSFTKIPIVDGKRIRKTIGRNNYKFIQK